MLDIIFKIMQIANVLAALLVIRESIKPLYDWFHRSKKSIDIEVWILSIGALGLSFSAVLAFAPRIMDNKINWLDTNEMTPLTANTSMILLFFVLFWFHHLLRKSNGSSSWQSQHILMLIVLIVSTFSTVAEYSL